MKVPVLSSLILCHARQAGGEYHSLLTGPCVFRCKSGVHVIVNGVYGIDTGLSCFSSQAAISNGCLRRRCRSRLVVDLLLYTRSALQRSQRAVFSSGVNVFNFQHMLFKIFFY